MSNTKIEKINDHLYDLSGHLDSDSISKLMSQLNVTASQKNETITVDLKSVTHSSSAGLALLLEWLRQADKNNFTLQFTNMPTNMQAIAEICGLTGILPIK